MPENAIIKLESRSDLTVSRAAELGRRRGLLSVVRTLRKRIESVWGRDFDRRVDALRHRYAKSGDPFGLDLEVAQHTAQVCALFHRLYFRTQCHGLGALPEGRLLLVANHAGQLPIDAVIIASAMFFDAEPPRLVRALVERWAVTLPFVWRFFSRIGQVVGVAENARRLLERDEMLLTFPEGVRGISKPITRRYQLEGFSLGFMRLALRTQTPIVPIGVVGSEEQYPSLGSLEPLAKLLGLPALPVLPQLLLPFGALPLPVKYHLHFGEPMRFSGDADAEDAEISEKVWVVRQTIQRLLAEGVRQRRGIFA